MAAVSLKCGDCGTLFKSVEEAQEHAELTSHSNFVESTEAVLNLVCSTCGKPCRSKTETDLHIKRSRHTEFVDKTLEAAKSISLEVPKAADAGADGAVDASTSQSEEMVVPEVDKKLLEELEAMGFSTARATCALHYSAGKIVIGDFLMTYEHIGYLKIFLGISYYRILVPANTKVEASKPSLTPEELKAKQQELRERAHKKKEEEEKRTEREREKAERRRKLELPLEDTSAVKSSAPVVEETKSSLPIRPATRVEQMRECLRSLKQNYKERVSALKGGVEFLELCGFEKQEGGEFLIMPRDKVDMVVLNSAGSELDSAIKSPFFRVLKLPQGNINGDTTLTRSALSLSSTQAYLNDLLFISAASFSSLNNTRLSIPPGL
ncbi:hypothetical protein FNV43_RR01231 [Rhamnella rubrinervis]|uniref:C2H2-type domain-containing protein n=1 Tax=Rhamnella rubrinervis TaxID=2594499 RepID=A0A8K0MS36_9ROSA|nr:hypothetical protein FNV43_RR01231 [Rhamnella rubrinervis]